MYMNKMVSIGKAENGYVIECTVPIKKKEKKNNSDMIGEYPGSSEKKYIAKEAKDVVAIIEKLMPMLDDKFTSEKEFDMAFNKAAGVKDED